MRRRAHATAVVLGASLLSTACAGHGLSLSTGSNVPPDPRLLLSCARAIAADKGLGDISQSTEPFELQAKGAVQAGSAASPSYDLLTVTLSPAKRGFRMLVGSATYGLRQLRSATTTVGTSAGTSRMEWVATAPSTRVVMARDAVLAQCGSVGS